MYTNYTLTLYMSRGGILTTIGREWSFQLLKRQRSQHTHKKHQRQGREARQTSQRPSQYFTNTSQVTQYFRYRISTHQYSQPHYVRFSSIHSRSHSKYITHVNTSHHITNHTNTQVFINQHIMSQAHVMWCVSPTCHVSHTDTLTN
jgi:hypothetical protein